MHTIERRTILDTRQTALLCALVREVLAGYGISVHCSAPTDPLIEALALPLAEAEICLTPENPKSRRAQGRLGEDDLNLIVVKIVLIFRRRFGISLFGEQELMLYELRESIMELLRKQGVKLPEDLTVVKWTQLISARHTPQPAA